MGVEGLFDKVLVANRGEIAVRIIRACRELGIRTVAVYSEADAGALHVALADEAYCVGPAPDVRSYLNVGAILEVAARTGAEAVHPGYGFLAENPHFAAVCRAWGLDFIGPDPEVIERMGSKALARQAMLQAGVPVVPGSPGVVESPDEALEIAADIGYPVLIKAAAGGGGRGIRVAGTPGELEEMLEAAQREAARFFGQGDVYLERFLEDPRHVEVQILADRHAHVVHLGERECSVQRRRQKILEEAPSPALSPAQRRALCEAAVRAATAVGYNNAGTVEFLVDRSGSFYFCEMNTRIQVEHPVTEMVTGVDIVKEQIRVAAGLPLRFRQEDVQPRGWAMECRITAEDPDNRLLPSPGTVTELALPGGPGVRVDSGVGVGSQVPPYYDSLIAKVICWGEDREEARARMGRALRELRVGGIRTIVPLLEEILRHPDFRAGQYHTRFLEEALLAARR